MKSSRTSALIVAGRLVLVVLAAGAAVTSLVVWRKGGPSPIGAVSRATYVCPMHPEVTSPSTGDCPICRMALVPKAGPPEAASAERAGLRARATADTPPAASGTLTLPPGKELHGYDAISRTKRFETALEMRTIAAADSRQTGVALFHLDESALIRPGEEGLFSPSSGPRAGAPLGLKVRIVEGPRERWDRSTVLVRFLVDGDAELVPQETGILKLATRLRNDLVVHASSIIDSPEGPYVLTVSDDRRTMTKRPVEVGTRLYGEAAVASGLRRGEQVAAKHTFVLEVERRLDRRATP